MEDSNNDLIDSQPISNDLFDNAIPAYSEQSAISRLRYFILATAFTLLVLAFWLLTRYPQLLEKASHIGTILPSMGYSSELFQIDVTDPIWMKIGLSSLNWLDSMKIGMSFGILLGALLHTYLHYFPLKLSSNTRFNALKGAVIGAPMGICANCAVPTACGVTRGNGRVELVLGFLFSSPNFNPVVLMMTFLALPLLMGFTKYLLLIGVILIVVPTLINWLEKRNFLGNFSLQSENSHCSLPPIQPSPKFSSVFVDMTKVFKDSVWMLLKPTITIMIIASVLTALLLTLLPWQDLLSEATPLRMALASFLSTLIPVPIALDVLFSAQLHSQGIASGYVILFASTLGTYSIIPMIYLWREVSKILSVSLYLFFVVSGFFVGMVF